MSDKVSGFIEKLKIQTGGSPSKQISLKLALPNGQKGSGLTIIIGQDQAGKESIIHNLKQTCTTEQLVYMPPMLNLAERQPPGEAKGAICRFKRAADDASKHPLLFDALAEVWHNKDYKQELNRLLDKMLPELGLTWSLQEPRSETSTFDMKTREMPSMELMTTGGVLPVFYACLHLIETTEEIAAHKESKPANMLLISEPEKFLLSSGVDALAEAVAEIASHQQVVVCTLSGQMIRIQDYVNGAQVAILGLDNKKQATFRQLQPSKIYAPLADEHIKQIENPEIINTVFSGMLETAKRVLIIESAAELDLIANWEKENDLLSTERISGYAAGGASRMKFLLAMAADLGIPKVAAVYKNNPKSAETLKKDRQRFGRDSDWRFIQLTVNEQEEAKGLKRFLKSKQKNVAKASPEDMRILTDYFK